MVVALYYKLMQRSQSLTLKFAQFNVENLFIFMDLFSPSQSDIKNLNEVNWQQQTASHHPNKELFKLFDIARIINDIDADFYMLNEVGGLESLTNFNTHFLNNEYHVFLIEGNSDRGIDVGYLVKKSLPFQYLHLSHKARPIPLQLSSDAEGKVHYFARDVSELRVFNQSKTKCLFVLLLVHLKSKLDPEGLDFQGRQRRLAEAQELINIYHSISQEFHHEIPILIAGDMNGTASPLNTEPEFECFYSDGQLEEVFEAAKIPAENRFTQVQVSKTRPYFMQLDYILANPHFMKNLIPEQCFAYRFKSELGGELPTPETLDQRSSLPSDHYPVVATFEASQFYK